MGDLPHVGYHRLIVKHVLHVKCPTAYFLHESAFHSTVRLKIGISRFGFGVKIFLRKNIQFPAWLLSHIMPSGHNTSIPINCFEKTLNPCRNFSVGFYYGLVTKTAWKHHWFIRNDWGAFFSPSRLLCWHDYISTDVLQNAVITWEGQKQF